MRSITFAPMARTRTFEVSFLGKETQIYGRSSIGYISDRSKKWTVPWRLISNKFQAAAIEYLKGDGRLAVIPSLGDNFPNTVLECVSAGIPFLASNIGGIPEVVAAEDRAEVCFEPGRISSQTESGMRWQAVPSRHARRFHLPTTRGDGQIGTATFEGTRRTSGLLVVGRILT